MRRDRMAWAAAAITLAAALIVLAAGPPALAAAPSGLSPGDLGAIKSAVSDAVSGLLGDVGNILQNVLGGIGGQVNAWIAGTSLAVLFAINGFPDAAGWIQSLISGSPLQPSPAPIYPWHIGGFSPWPDPVIAAAGASLFVIALVKFALRAVIGDASARGSIIALALSFALLVGAPALVWGGSEVFNQVSDAVVASVRPPVPCGPAAPVQQQARQEFQPASPQCAQGYPYQKDPMVLLLSTLGLAGPDGLDAVKLASLAGLVAFGMLSAQADPFSILTQLALGIPALWIALWALVMDAVTLQSLLALFFLAASRWAPVAFGLFADRISVPVGWLRLALRAFLAIGITAGAGMAWLGWVGNAQSGVSSFAGQLLLGAGVPVVALAFYIIVAFALWAVWTRPLLLLVYQTIPAVAAWLEGGHRAARGASQAMRRIGVGGPALAVAGTAAEWLGSAASATRVAGRAIGAVGRALPGGLGWQDPAAGLDFSQRPELAEPQAGAEPVPRDLGLRVTATEPVETDGGAVVAARVPMSPALMGEFRAWMASLPPGRRLPESFVLREDGGAIWVDAGLWPAAHGRFVEWLLEHRIVLIRDSRGRLVRVLPNGSTAIVPEEWSGAKNAVLLGDIGGRRW
ncbi:MAG: hypothetical protein QJR08_00300 [Bacillota bacterium]|nr:hypothetical protein [Bacillota bacterium]